MLFRDKISSILFSLNFSTSTILLVASWRETHLELRARRGSRASFVKWKGKWKGCEGNDHQDGAVGCWGG